MKVAIYARVSTQDQHLEQQLNPCIEECSKRGWEYESFTDKISGAKSSRPELDYMLQRLRKDEFNAVMVWKFDRLGRSTIHLIQLVEEFKNKGIQFIALTQGIDTSTPQGKFFLTIMAGVAELEREMIRERTQARLDMLKAKGKKLGRPKGSKDKGQRRKSGYLIRWAGKELTPLEIVTLKRRDEQTKQLPNNLASGGSQT